MGDWCKNSFGIIVGLKLRLSACRNNFFIYFLAKQIKSCTYCLNTAHWIFAYFFCSGTTRRKQLQLRRYPCLILTRKF